MVDTDALNESLELIILPTEECNFRCVYCYEDFKIKKMGRATIDSIKKFLELRVPDLKVLKFQWFGGEPLLALDVIEEISSHAARAIAKSGGNTAFIGTATTNGSLLNITNLKKLISLNVSSFQISFDGDLEEHDKLRLSAAGAGTFNTIWKNIIDAKRSDLRFNIIMRIHANQNNQSSIKRLLERISTEIGQDSRFVIHIRELSKLGGKNDALLPIDNDTNTVIRLRDYCRSLGLTTLNFDIYKKDFAHVCYAAKPNSYVIRANGDISKCTVALYSDFNRVGHINQDGTLELDRDKILDWSRGLFSGQKEERECPLHGFPRYKKIMSDLKSQ